MNGEFEQINPLTGVLGEPDELRGSLDGPLTRGYSAYEIYLEHGGTMTEEEWLASLKGEKGDEPEITTQRTGSKQTTIYADGKQIGIILDGEEGDPGGDGISPTITVVDITGGHRITITDTAGQHVFDVLDGDPGDPGDPGKDGISPSVSVTNITGGHKITITDATGTHEFNVMDGTKGDPGYTPQKGTDYDDGQDGISPVVTVQDITGGHRVTITDVQGSHTYDVMDGTKGDPGSPGHTPVRGTDYWTAQDKSDMVDDVLASQEISDMSDDITDLKGALTQKYEKPATGIPASDLEDGVIPDLTDYVKNTDYADENNAGVVKSSTYYGTRMLPNGAIGTYRALIAGIKGGIDDYRPIVPYVQDVSTFYGLAKAAGDSTQSASSNAVGVYTDSAKVAIQKMLGIYEAPWELIREETFTNAEAASHEIAVDGNGNAFELTDVMLMFELPKQDTASAIGSSGLVKFVTNCSNWEIRTEHGAYSQAANADAHGTYDIIQQNKGMFISMSSAVIAYANSGSAYRTRYIGFSSQSAMVMNGNFFANEINPTTGDVHIKKIIIASITGTGHYKLYGKRKWQ